MAVEYLPLAHAHTDTRACTHSRRGHTASAVCLTFRQAGKCSSPTYSEECPLAAEYAEASRPGAEPHGGFRVSMDDLNNNSNSPNAWHLLGAC